MVDLSKFISNEVCSQTLFLHLRIKLYNCMGSFFFFFLLVGGGGGGTKDNLESSINYARRPVGLADSEQSVGLI